MNSDRPAVQDMNPSVAREWKIKLSWKLADAHLLLASSHKREKDHPSALTHYTKARTLYSQLCREHSRSRGAKGVQTAKRKARTACPLSLVVVSLNNPVFFIQVQKIIREISALHILLSDYPSAERAMHALVNLQGANAPGGRYDEEVAASE